MARSASAVANNLSDLYDESYNHSSFEPFRITWPQLRSLAAVPRLKEDFLKEISEALSENERTLIPFNNFLLVTTERDLKHYRALPDLLLEQYLPDSVEQDEDSEDVELEDEDEDDD